LHPWLSSTLYVLAMHSSKILVNFYQNTWCNLPEGVPGEPHFLQMRWLASECVVKYILLVSEVTASKIINNDPSFCVRVRVCVCIHVKGCLCARMFMVLMLLHLIIYCLSLYILVCLQSESTFHSSAFVYIFSDLFFLLISVCLHV
jgi:hypothetical protein